MYRLITAAMRRPSLSLVRRSPVSEPGVA
jgi:hypothetical protein